jgi:hypothetical protein
LKAKNAGSQVERRSKIRRLTELINALLAQKWHEFVSFPGKTVKLQATSLYLHPMAEDNFDLLK